MQEIHWMKGTPRSERDASACEHLKINVLTEISIHKIKIARKVQLAHEAGFEEVETEVIKPVQPMTMICVSPVMLDALRAGLPGHLRPQLQAISVNMDICKLCPFWQPMNSESTGDTGDVGGENRARRPEGSESRRGETS